MSTGTVPTPKTKIVCTIGPASSEPATLRALCEAGMDVVRINMSHTSADECRRMVRDARKCADQLGVPLGILVDLQGPKIRLGKLDRPVSLDPGDSVVLVSEGVEAGENELPVTYDALADDVANGDRILVDDGRVELRVREVAPHRVRTEVAVGGTVRSGKGINLPGVRVSAPGLTEKDHADIEVAREIDADYVALSFVRSAQHVQELRDQLPEGMMVMTKIEKDSALDDLDAILSSSDAVVVARGDLGTELPFEQVPLTQKRIVRAANERFCPVVVATEMFESMIERPRPTRAEVSDAANAILEGTDAVMLSAETAVGKYPVKTVEALTRVIAEIETRGSTTARRPIYDVADVPARLEGADLSSTELAVARATLEAADAVRAPAIVTFTKSGHTARVVASRRPPVPVMAITDSGRVYRQLALVWGVVPIVQAGEATYETMWETARSHLLQRGMAEEGDRIVLTAGMPFQVRGTTNMMHVQTV
ncbi:MAG: pyruvate kinase [Gemmatimonadetes bacterium]|uniref:Pyruvate kinase n=1 Tax=Candidatus Kutchimonas denitrificans TaxID=3056748 RepID=A0AAE4Z7R0_9BACT|nr:pyruvate kinase [Gemmatimonadota bacterium]NIR75365.1 pyruvate kinase [Candidatus Kutchimonas denitrificans]NIS01007.1 pyruvate kinase [Gemmatimonadota bacterium]NIT66631.1 pyruvate kinase [Gemmatimonadota bacterium]NIU53211.1 pyruvate kinase [Gemmatimonadota bacterium]